ncbi:MAG: ribose 5-phosphate isomerase B [Clostridia bacterium]|nr:ribose 5-phosphate isomerase B [Clostridia bacterium]
MLIGLGSDHGGLRLKEEIAKYLKEKGYDYRDYGTCDCGSVDYPDYGLIVAEAVKNGECDKGIIICGTGLGISLAANKVPGIRAAVCTDTYMARMSREHNDANILALGERVTGPGLALEIVQAWLDSEFLGGRHKVRVDKICAIEKKYSK